MVKLTAAATTSIPRIIIFALTLVYGFAGLFARDPWKNEDAIGFGGMWALQHSTGLFRILRDVIFLLVHPFLTG
jgi:hypothetical protein